MLCITLYVLSFYGEPLPYCDKITVLYGFGFKKLGLGQNLLGQNLNFDQKFFRRLPLGLILGDWLKDTINHHHHSYDHIDRQCVLKDPECIASFNYKTFSKILVVRAFSHVMVIGH